MKRVVVLGHGGYAKGVKGNLDMIVGKSKHMYFIDLTKEDDLASFEKKVNNLLVGFGDEEVLFVCDLLGASPFRIAATISAKYPGKYCTVAGLNTMAFIELSRQNDLSIEELAKLAIDITKSSVDKFPK